MPGIANLVANGDWLTIVIIIVILIITGGVGKSIIDSRGASKRGIKGDALVKEQNGIEGLTNLGNLQDAFITKLQAQNNSQQEQINELSYKVDNIATKLEEEISYSNLLIQTLSDNTIPIPPRKKRA